MPLAHSLFYMVNILDMKCRILNLKQGALTSGCYDLKAYLEMPREAEGTPGPEAQTQTFALQAKVQTGTDFVVMKNHNPIPGR